MITKADRRKPPRSWQGQRLIALRELANGYGAIPAGTLVEVKRKYDGLEIEAVPCTHCGLKLHLTRVRFDAVDWPAGAGAPTIGE